MTELAGFRDAAWAALEAALQDRDDPMRHVVLATLNGERPDARILILRNVDRSTRVVEVHTDALSSKVSELERSPQACFLAWSPKRQLQLRLHVDVSVQSGSGVADLWEKVPEPSRLGYGGIRPGTPIQDHSPRGPADAARFAVIRGTVSKMDVLELGSPYHRRAFYTASDGFSGQWVSP